METNHNPKMSAANLSGASGPASAPWFARGQLAAGQRSVPTGTDPVVVATVSAAGSEPTPTAAHTATSATAADATADITESPPVSRLRLEIGWQAILALAAAPFLAFALMAAMRALIWPLAILFLGAALASALAAPVGWLSRRLPRTAAIVIVHLTIALFLIGVFAPLTPTLIDQVQQFNQSAPDMLNWVNQWLNRFGLQNIQPLISQTLPSMVGLSSELLTLPMAVSDVLFTMLGIVFFSIYGLMAAPSLREFIKSLAPEWRRAHIHAVLDKLVDAIGGYMRGIFIMGVFVGILTYIGLRIIGLPYPVVLGVLAGVMEAVPVIGTIISVLVITGVALLTSTTTALITFAYMTTIQLIEGNILFPNVMGRETHSTPLLSMFAFFAGMSVGGIVGGIIGVPIAAALRVLTVELIAPAVRRWTGAET
ncbi:MAG: AI-2E family transporter [Caldilineaceae bacterium]|nr:AI-2E family transporter [Caldilineaceae bacterium]